MDTVLAGFRRAQVRRGLLANTIRVRVYVVRAFANHIGGSPPHLWAATREQVEDFCDVRCKTASARRNYVAHIHAFYEWATDEGLAETDPTARIRRPRVRQRRPRAIPHDDLRRALALSTKPKIRLAVLLGAYAGLRCQEIAGLRAEDVDLHQETITVLCGKGERDRIVPLHPEIAAQLAIVAIRHGPIFGVTPRTMSRALNEFLRDTGTPCTAHSLRHWFATELYRATGDILLVRDMLGHESVQTTQVYADFDHDRARMVGRLAIHPEGA